MADWGWRNDDGVEPRQRQIRAGIEGPIAALAETEPMPSGARDHGGIVGVQAGARDRDAGEPRQPLRGATRERLTAGDAAAQHRGVTARGAPRALPLPAT